LGRHTAWLMLAPANRSPGLRSSGPGRAERDTGCRTPEGSDAGCSACRRRPV